MKKGASAKRRRAKRVAKYIRDLGGPEHVGTADAELLDDLAAIRTNIERLQAAKDAGKPIDEDELKGFRWQAIQLRGALKSGRNPADFPRAPMYHVSIAQIREAEERVRSMRALIDGTEPAEADANLLAAPAAEPEPVPDPDPSPSTKPPETTIQ